MISNMNLGVPGFQMKSSSSYIPGVQVSSVWFGQGQPVCSLSWHYQCQCLSGSQHSGWHCSIRADLANLKGQSEPPARVAEVRPGAWLLLDCGLRVAGRASACYAALPSALVLVRNGSSSSCFQVGAKCKAESVSATSTLLASDSCRPGCPGRFTMTRTIDLENTTGRLPAAAAAFESLRLALLMLRRPGLELARAAAIGAGQCRPC